CIRMVDAYALADRTADGTTRNPPPGWDVANAVEEGWDLDVLREAAIATATRFDAALALTVFNSHQLSEHRHTNSRPTGLERRFPLVRFADLTASKAPPQLVRSLIPRVGLTVVWGPPKSAKSFIILSAGRTDILRPFSRKRHLGRVV